MENLSFETQEKEKLEEYNSHLDDLKKRLVILFSSIENPNEKILETLEKIKIWNFEDVLIQFPNIHWNFKNAAD